MARIQNGTRATTIDDVARAAGVSRATVSRVMNGKSTVDGSLAERVLQAAQTLRYQPSTTARSLSLGRTNTVAVAVPDLTNPMFQDVLRGVSDAAARRGYQVLVANTGGDPEAELASISDARRRCDAIVLVSPRLQEPALRALLPALEPVVVVNRLPDGVTPTIGVDYADGADQLLEHLLALGHRHLVYLSGPPLSESNVTRVDAMRRGAARRSGVQLTEIDAGASIESGYQAGEAVLETRATAVVAYNDLVAFGLLARLNELGVAVPADISVAGFDNIPLARFAVPPLTTVAIPHTQLGALAWEQLTALLDDVGRSDPPLWRPALIARASTGVVPAIVGGTRTDQVPDGGASVPALRALDWRPVDGESTSERVLVAALDDGAELDVCRAVSGDAVPPVHSPRPHLHPVRTAAGVDLTDVTPADHRHHYGVSMAVALVNGTSFWGGRTYIRDEGPTLLANHGRQRLVADEVEGGVLRQRIVWEDQHGARILTEDRTLEAGLLDDRGWSLRWRSELHASDGDLLIESPATAGRRGAGYGGIFWRLGPATTTTVVAAHGEGQDAVHGSISPWVALVQHRGPRAATLVLAQRQDDIRPWFLRASDYAGAGPALAWDTPVRVAAGESLVLDLGAALIDGALDVDAAARVAALVT